MQVRNRIRVLIVDDSMVFREVLHRGISSDSNIEVVAKARDPFDARDKIIEYEPDVMICDVEMPRMNGIEFIRRLMPQYPLPVIVVSSLSGIVFDALNAGAVDFVGKPNIQSARDVESFIRELIEKVKIASRAKVLKTEAGIERIESNDVDSKNRLIAIGASTGGTEAIHKILKSLPKNAPGIVIVQHIPPVFSRMFAERLDNSTLLNVKEAKTGAYVGNGDVLVAPGGQHMRLKKLGNRYRVECFEGEKVNGHIPSIDILFESVAELAGENSIGIILTGMGYDGAKGLLSIRRKGGRTIGQDEGTSVVYGMPKVAYNIGAVEYQLALGSIAKKIHSILGSK